MTYTILSSPISFFGRHPAIEAFLRQASGMDEALDDLPQDGRKAVIPAEEIERRVFAMGFNQIMCSFVVCDDLQIDTGGLPGWAGNYLGGLRLFADEVLPKIKRS